MTGVEELQKIVAFIDSVMPAGPDPETHRAEVLIGIAPGVLQRAAQLISENKFDVATDLVVAGNALIVDAYTTLMQERARAGKWSLEESLQRMRDGDTRSNTRLHQREPDSSAIPVEELVELGVIANEDDVADPNRKDACDFKFVGFVHQLPTCSECEGDVAPVVTMFGVEIGGHSVIGTSLCEEHMKRIVDGLHDAPHMHQVAQVLFVRDDEDVEDEDEDDDDDYDPDTACNPALMGLKRGAAMP